MPGSLQDSAYYQGFIHTFFGVQQRAHSEWFLCDIFEKCATVIKFVGQFKTSKKWYNLFANRKKTIKTQYISIICINIQIIWSFPFVQSDW